MAEVLRAPVPYRTIVDHYGGAHGLLVGRRVKAPAGEIPAGAFRAWIWPLMSDLAREQLITRGLAVLER